MNTNADLIMQFLNATGQSGSDITHALCEIGGGRGMKAGVYEIAKYYSAKGMNEGMRRGFLGGILTSIVCGCIVFFCSKKAVENSQEKYQSVAYPQVEIDRMEEKILSAMTQSEKTGPGEGVDEIMEDDNC